MIAGLLLAMALAGPSADGTVTKAVATREVATCMIRIAESQSKRFLETTPGSDAARSIGADLLFSYNRCVGPRNVFSGNLDAIRGAIAEVWFDCTPGALDTAATLVAVAPVRLPDAFPDNAFRPAFATCVATAVPAKTAAMLRIGYGSPEERQAVLAMGETLMACLPMDVTYHLKTDELRPYLAAALFYASVHGRAA
jgi:hypothetical protein